MLVESTCGDVWLHVTVELEDNPLGVNLSDERVSSVSMAVKLVVLTVGLEKSLLDWYRVGNSEDILELLSLPCVLGDVFKVGCLGDNWLLVGHNKLVGPEVVVEVGDLEFVTVGCPHHCLSSVDASETPDWAFTLLVDVSSECGVSTVEEVVDVVPVLLGWGDGDWEVGFDVVASPPYEPSHHNLVFVTIFEDSENMSVVDKLTVWMRLDSDIGISVVIPREISDSVLGL